MTQISLSGVSVMIIMVVKGAPTLQTTMSLLRTTRELERRGIEHEITFQIDGNVEYARSKAAHEFLKSEHHRVFWIDADMDWTAEDFLRVLALSMKMDIVGAVYTARCDPPRFIGLGFPEAKQDEEVTLYGNEWGCIEATGFGFGFVCCSRYAVQKVTDAAEKIKFALSSEPMAHIFACEVVNGEFVGEDIAFFNRARRLGMKVYFDPRITLGHVGTKVFSASFEKHLAQFSDGSKQSAA